MRRPPTGAEGNINFISNVFSFLDSDSEEDEPAFFMANDPSGGRQQSGVSSNHNLSLLSLTVMIDKGRLQARTDKKVSQVIVCLLIV